MSSSKLFQPIQLGHSTLQHRIALLPLTRYRNDEHHVATPSMTRYYGDRASAPGTLIISEATGIAHQEEAEPNLPAVASARQAKAWKQVIDAVHANGSVFFQQLWAMGLEADPAYLKKRGYTYRSCSDVVLDPSKGTPQPMTEEDILAMIDDFVASAKRITDAGADGVEIHGAHGYLLDQFFSDEVNNRTDRWGGPVENRARLIIEVVKAVAAAVGAERTALRLSPFSKYEGTGKKDAYGDYTYLLTELKKHNVKLAYLSLVEPRDDDAPAAPDAGADAKQESLDYILELWDNQSPVVLGGGYTPENAASAVEGQYKKWDVIVGFGRNFLANPDLVYRVQNGVELNKYDRSTFYDHLSEAGYNDYPFSEQYLASMAEAVVARS